MVSTLGWSGLLSQSNYNVSAAYRAGISGSHYYEIKQAFAKFDAEVWPDRASDLATPRLDAPHSPVAAPPSLNCTRAWIAIWSSTIASAPTAVAARVITLSWRV